MNEHRGLDHRGVISECVQEIHFCIDDYGPIPYYVEDGITIFNADCRDVLPFLKADLVITDPPYNAGKNYGSKTNDRRAWPDWAAWLDERLQLWSAAAPETLMFLSQTAYRHYVRHGIHCNTIFRRWPDPALSVREEAPLRPF